jgi:hypothetical protein
MIRMLRAYVALNTLYLHLKTNLVLFDQEWQATLDH